MERRGQALRSEDENLYTFRRRGQKNIDGGVYSISSK
jgi:hypothetical protein